MISNSLILDGLNKIFTFSQNKFSYLWEKSFFLKNLDRVIFATILGVFVLSTFASSDLIGYVALVTLFLTIIKLFVKKGERIGACGKIRNFSRNLPCPARTHTTGYPAAGMGASTSKVGLEKSQKTVIFWIFPHPLDLNLFEIFLLIYFLIVIISLAGSSLFYLSFKGFLKTFTYLGFYFSTVQYFKNNLGKIPLTIFIIALCAASQGIIGIFQNFSQVGEISTWQDVSNINPEDVMTRVYGTLTPYNPNLFGGYLVASLPCLFGGFILWILEKKYKLAGVFLTLASITSFALILSGCRGAYVGFLAIMLCFFGFLAKFIWKDLENKKEFFKKMYLSFLGAIVAFSACVVLFVSSIRTRVLSIFAMRGDSSTSFRFNVYQSAIQMAKDNWALGIGVGNQNFREIYGLYMRTGFDALSAYCVFLEISVESGIFALLAFLAFLVTLGYKSIKFILDTKDLKSSIIVTISIITVLSIMVHGLVDTIFFRPQVQFIFWTMVAFITAVAVEKKYKIGEN